MTGAEITAIVPVRNGARYLPDALDSLCAQTVAPARIVVVDDGSSDGSSELARGAGAIVIRIGAEPAGVGAGAARNAGARVAQTPLIAFLDADDRCRPDRFERQLAALRDDPTLDGVLGHVRQILSSDRPELAGRFVVPSAPMAGWHASALLIGRERFAATGGWSEDLTRHDTFDWFAAATEQGLRLAMLDDVVTERRIHGDNQTVRERADMQARYLRSARAAIVRRRAARGEA